MNTIYSRGELVLHKGIFWQAQRDEVLVFQPGDVRTTNAEKAWARAQLADQRLGTGVEVIKSDSGNGNAAESMRKLNLLAERFDAANAEGAKFADAVTLRLETLMYKSSTEREIP